MEGSIWIPMVPIAKGRPRLCYGRVLNPSRTVTAESSIKNYVFYHHRDRTVLKGPVKIELYFFFKGNECHPHIKRPDWDNLAKLVIDALGPQKEPFTKKWIPGLLFSDDCIICEAHVYKFYHPDQGIWLKFKTLDPDTIVEHPLHKNTSKPDLASIIQDCKDRGLTSIPISLLGRE